MTAPPAEKDRDRLVEEVDVWWGSYAGRDMAPSFAVCIGLTLLIYFGARWWVPERGWLQLTFSGVAGAVWLVQLTRWCRRFFTWNYRLTTRYLYVDRGLKPLIAQRHALAIVGRVEVQASPLQKWLGIGDVVVWLDDPAKPAAVLKALVGPRTAAEMIQDTVKNARENVQ